MTLDEKTVIEWGKILRNMCEWYLANHQGQIGGLGVVVEIDEALMAKRKNNRQVVIMDEVGTI